MTRTTFSRRTAFLAAAVLAMPLLAGCPTANTDTRSTTTGGTATGGTPENKGDDTTGGSLTISGSDTIRPLSERWVEEFNKQSPASISVKGGGSGQGISALINKSVDIANSSRKMKDEEMKTAEGKGLKVTEIAVAMDGITIIVNPKNPIKSLTIQQLADIYTGKVKDWKEIGGTPGKIVAIGRDSSSGTYEFFKEDVLKKADYRSDMVQSKANPAIGTSVGQNAGAIGYIGVAFASEYVKAGKVKEMPVAFKDGDEPILPTVENVHSGKYPISRSLYNYVAGEPEGLTKAYLDFVRSEEGQKIVADEGYITLK
ncbi:MAG: phosphate ABC transporter substrate-binding protein [Fibrella sp.]|nr:phosphate ABC transporter substrate-binding protein [Armatimonadota bacterium]